jgi:replicative DNA helicase
VRTVEEIEKTVFGACLIEDVVALDIITSTVRPEHFSYVTYEVGFRAILELHAEQQPVNFVTVRQILSKTHRLGLVSEPAITDATNGMPRRMGEQATWYVDALLEFYRKRQMAALAEELGAACLDASETSQSLTALAQTRLEALVSDSGASTSAIADITDELIAAWRAKSTLEHSPGMSFGVPELDEATGGILPGQQIVLGARSGVGKTTLMAQAIAENCRKGISVDAFLLEPTQAELAGKLWGIESGVPYDYILYPWKAPLEARRRVERAAVEVAQWPLRIHDRSAMSLDQIIGLARLGMHRYDSRLICVDYLQRVKIKSQDRQEDTRLRIGRASTALADLVKGTRTASLVLSQLNRRGGVETIPTMQDLRESGQIENDAHTIVLLHLIYDETNGHYTRQGAILVPKRRFGLPCNLEATMHATDAVWRCKPKNQPTWQEA